MSLRGAVKGVAEAALLGSGVAALARRRLRGRAVVLAYHNVIPDGAAPRGDRSLHLPQREFARQLDALAQTHDVVPLAAIDAPAGSRPRVVITFDDAYRGALTAGFTELARRGLPATVFVAPGLFDTATWWDRHGDATGEVPAPLRWTALTAHQGVGESVLAAFGRGAESLPLWAHIAGEAEVMAAARQPGITLGAHTWSHCNLAAVPADRLATELERPLAWLRGQAASVVPWLAYPYGLSSAAVPVAARRAGYVAALLVEGGWLPGRRGDAFALPRQNIPSGLSLAGFRLRMAGVLSA